MSCQIQPVAKIHDIEAVRRCLFPVDDLRGSDSWLQVCEVSVSPSGDIVVLANERRLVVLTAKWESEGSISQFQITYSGAIHESDNVKAVLCLPVVNETRSSHVVPDWTCILLGFESGMLRFYTEKCELLFEECLHNEVITSVKCRSQHNPRPDISPELHSEEIYVQYQSNLCVISGIHLFSHLRACRSQLARIQAKAESLEHSKAKVTTRKWGFQDQATINDICVIGVTLHGTFDHLLTASTRGGFDAKYKASAPYGHLVLCAGSRPFLGYQYALESGPTALFSDVAKAVATKIKSALPGWLTGMRADSDKEATVVAQPVDTMLCRFGLCDLRRTATDIVCSPDHKFAAVSDSLGRVLLVDAFRGITLHVFKGYRDAQCSFIQVPDERRSKNKIGDRLALFLVIYSGKKGTLEIFTVQQGSKVTAFSASKFSRLIYNNYGLMGFQTTTKSRYVCQYTTVFIDNDGYIKEILIPFHFALSEKKNKRSKDIHLFKKIKQSLKYGEGNTENITSETYNICSELKTTEVKTYLTDLLIMNKVLAPEDTLKCVECLKGSLTEDSSNDPDAETLKKTLNNFSLLLRFYIFCMGTSDLKQIECDNNEADQIYSLSLNPKTMDSLQKLLQLTTQLDELKQKRLKVGFADIKEVSAFQFLSVFEIKKSVQVTLKPDVSDSQMFEASQVVFHNYLTKGVDLNIFKKNMLGSKIKIEDLFKLLIQYWVNTCVTEGDILYSNMESLLHLVHMLVEVVYQENAKEENDNIEKFWLGLRNILSSSPHSFAVLTMAIVCRAVLQKIERENDDFSLEDEDIEIFSDEGVEWSMLIGKLEDISLLNIVMFNEAKAIHCSLPKLKHDRVSVSLNDILKGGKGSVSELVARWLTVSGIDPELMVLNDAFQQQEEQKGSTEEQPKDNKSSAAFEDRLPPPEIMPEKIEEIKSEVVLENINLMKTKFPYSLSADMLLTNMCWEYALAWQKNVQNLDNLKAFVHCLEWIAHSHIRLGLCNLAWNTHLKLVFDSACKLINKVGKLPKDKLCKQDTGLTDYQVTMFLEICTNFLNIYMESFQECNEIPTPAIHFELIWDNGPLPLAELALQQNKINYDILHLHYQLSACLQMLTTFLFKHSKPISTLFESYMVGLFFMDFQTSAQINWNHADTKVQSSREQFLFKVIQCSLENVTFDELDHSAMAHDRWMTRCLDLGALWNVDLDSLRRYRLVQVYTNGLDALGRTMLNTVQSRFKLGPELLAVCGKRLSQFLASDPEFVKNKTSLSTLVTGYIEKLDKEWCATSTLENIENLASFTASCLHRDSYEFKVAIDLKDGVQTIRSFRAS